MIQCIRNIGDYKLKGWPCVQNILGLYIDLKMFTLTQSGWTIHTRATFQIVHYKLHNAFALINDLSSKHIITDI